MVCSILLFLWVQTELSFDQHHKNSDRIYRVLQHLKFDGGVTWAITQGPVIPGLKEEVSEIKNGTRFANGSWEISFKDEKLSSVGSYVDPDFFDIFDVKVIYGELKSFDKEKYSAVISESLAEKLFGKNDPTGKSIKVYDRYLLKIIAVIEDNPRTSHFVYEFVGTMEFAKEIGYTVDGWKNSQFVSYVLLDNTDNLNSVNSKIKNHLKDKPTLGDPGTLSLQPLEEIHLTEGIGFENGKIGNKNYIFTFSTIACLILLIAGINFMNLSTARSSLRSKEIGIRKVSGASQKNLIYQFISESLFLSVISVVLAIFISLALLPYFNDLSSTKILTEDLLQIKNIILILSVSVFIGIAAGIYPAFYLSKLDPITNFAYSKKSKNNNIYIQKALVILQFTITVFLIISSFVINGQIEFFKNKDLGYDKSDLIYFESIRNNDKYNSFRNEVLSQDDFTNVGRAYRPIIPFITYTNSMWTWDGKIDKNETLFHVTYIDYDYLPTLGVDFTDGRTFSKEFKSDSSAVIINKAAADILGYKNPVGKNIYATSDEKKLPLKIIGVIENYNYESLHIKVEPLILSLATKECNFTIVRINSKNKSESITKLNSIYKKYKNEQELTYWFVDDRLSVMYRSEENAFRIASIFTFLTIFISSIGLLGFSSFTVNQKLKEISIKKVLGASNRQLFINLTKTFLFQIFVSNLIAIPVTYYFTNLWLNRFAFHYTPDIVIYLAGCLVSVLIVYLVVSFHTIKVTRTNPTEILNCE